MTSTHPPSVFDYQSRSELIHKLLNSVNDDAGSSSGGGGGDDGSSAESTTTTTRPPAVLAGGAHSVHAQWQRARQWHSSELMLADTMNEVYAKLDTLDKQIWGKLVCMEANRRTAKAYLRHPVITVDGSRVEFDGFRWVC